jgi:hypothetical protein
MNFRDVVRVRGCGCVRGYVLHGSSLVLCYTTLIAIRASCGAREETFEHRPGGTLYNKWDLQGDV